MKYERTVDPAVFPVTLELVETSLNIPSGTDTDLINLYIGAATDALEADTDRAIISQTWKYTLDKFPGAYNDYTFFIPKGTTISVTSYKYIDVDGNQQTLVDGTDYEITQTGDQARIIPIGSYPDTITTENEVVELIVVSGIGTTTSDSPDWVQNAIILKVKGLYDDCFEKYKDAYNSQIVKRKLFFDYSINDQ
jgi:uncharacterized phiE125 gp8 family phage protein